MRNVSTVPAPPRRPASSPSTERRCTLYVSSVMLPAEIFPSALRGHWSVENENHSVRDVTLAEDASPHPRKSGRHGAPVSHRQSKRRRQRRPRSIPPSPLLPRPAMNVERPTRSGHDPPAGHERLSAHRRRFADWISRPERGWRRNLRTRNWHSVRRNT